MELALFVYLAGVVSSIGTVLFTASIVGLIALILFWIITLIGVAESCWTFSKFANYLRNATIGVFSLGIITAIIPSEKTMYMMLAGYTAQTVVQSDTAAKVLKVINQKLDGYLEEATKDTK